MSAATPIPAPNRALPLLIAAGILGAFFVGWTWLALDQSGDLVAFDLRCADYWREHGRDSMRGSMVFLTDLGNVAANLLVAVMAVIWQLSHGRRGLAAAWIAIVLGGGIANQALKITLDRDRPPTPDPVVMERNKSYPSGHAMGATVSYGLLSCVLARQTRLPFRRAVTGLLFLLLVAGIGFSRIYLRAHWFSDVVGGCTAGLCWLCVSLAWLEQQRQWDSGPGT
jgi:undecaprenyl-diphosphatase